MKQLDVPLSGSQASTTASRNRYGQYRRSRATPVNPNSDKQGVVRARLSANAAAWRTLTDEQRQGWGTLGGMMTRSDSLGQQYTLTGFQAYVSVNNNLSAAGAANITDAPALSTPEAIATVTITCTTSALSVAYTPTPLSSGERLFSFASPQRSAGRGFEGDYRLIAVSAAAAVSPADIEAAYVARLGTLVQGNRIFFRFFRYFAGFLSGPLSTSAVVG